MLTPFDSPKSLHWQQSLRSPIIRQLEIFSFTMQFLTFLLWDRLTGANRGKKRQRRAKWLVDRLMNLGPTFIKIGQSLSTRADLIPLEYIEQLTQLQDRVPEFNSQEAIRVIETELGQPLDNLFESFTVSPLACASLGQVHRARLLSGEEVVIKVQKKYEIEAIYQEFFALLFQEIDYIHEGKNAERFRLNFSQYPQVKVPKVYWQYTSRSVLTLEYLPGIKVNDRASLMAAGINLEGVIQTGICAYLKQLLLDGFFQSDPHPGNMAVDGKGELIFYDFGTMAEVKTVAKEQMVQTFFAILRKDANQVLQTLIYMGLIEPVADMRAVKRIIDFLLDNFRDKPVDIRAFEQIGDEVYTLFRQQPFRLPPQMTFILKSIATLDGIARALDPQYNLIAASQPFIESITIQNPTSSLAMSLLRQTRSLLVSSLQVFTKNPSPLQELEARIERGDLQVQIRSPHGDRLLKKIHLVLKCLFYACLTGFSLLTAALLLSTVYQQAAIVGFGLGGLFSLLLVRAWLQLAVQERLDRWASK